MNALVHVDAFAPKTLLLLQSHVKFRRSLNFRACNHHHGEASHVCCEEQKCIWWKWDGTHSRPDQTLKATLLLLLLAVFYVGKSKNRRFKNSPRRKMDSLRDFNLPYLFYFAGLISYIFFLQLCRTVAALCWDAPYHHDVLVCVTPSVSLLRTANQKIFLIRILSELFISNFEQHSYSETCSKILSSSIFSINPSLQKMANFSK